jgi:RNA polymerase sigma-70 factor, ECF subfamily
MLRCSPVRLELWVQAVMVQTTRAGDARAHLGAVMSIPEEQARPDWSAFYGQLHRFVAVRVRDAADTDDLVQLILERAVSKRPRDGEVESVAAWLFAIARNAVLDHQRAEQRNRTAALRQDQPILEPAAGADSRDRDEVLACVRPMLDGLPEDARQLLEWADVEERPLQTIAAALGISLTATKSRVQRARRSFVEITQRCCTVTLDARGRVNELSPRRANSCDPDQLALCKRKS